ARLGPPFVIGGTFDVAPAARTHELRPRLCAISLGVPRLPRKSERSEIGDQSVVEPLRPARPAVVRAHRLCPARIRQIELASAVKPALEFRRPEKQASFEYRRHRGADTARTGVNTHERSARGLAPRFVA